MTSLYVEGLDDNLKPIFMEFDRVCNEENCLYSIDNDEHYEQGYILSKEDAVKIENHMRDYVSNKNVVFDCLQNRGKVLFKFSVKPIQEHVVDSNSFSLNNLDENSLSAIIDIISNYGYNFDNVDLEVPVLQCDLGSLWDRNQDNPRMTDIEPARMKYAEEFGEMEPIVVDDVSDNSDYLRSCGPVLDGVKRMCGCYNRGDEEIPAIMLSDILSSLNEDSLKYPTRKHLRDQSQFPSSFNPSKSHGGVSAYGSKKRK